MLLFKPCLTGLVFLFLACGVFAQHFEDTVFVSGTFGTRIYDVSDSASPRLASIFTTGGVVRDVDVAGSRAYLADGSALTVIDVSDIGQPVFLGSFALPGKVNSVVVSGQFAYVALEHSGISIVNVSSPFSMAPVSDFSECRDVSGISYSRGYLYVACSDEPDGFMAVDVSDAHNPFIAGEGSYFGSSPAAIFVSGGMAYAV